ncbi:TetR/AcrR family transcriptional regulator [Anaerosporobacter sp.]|uniref:TetR/AcrR family transcriptional regulator n=1 Tax=Anaerosporobacter sp. TaxID=1872529 RepID=UPI00286F2BFF|nr:TetR/AcrR family transcriptional regulator [Anaerosporobacter sp.]
MPKQTFFNLQPAKQRNVVYAALTEFTNKGYLLGSVGDIAKSAVVSKGSMYQYFEDKKEFYMYLTDYAYSMIKTAMKTQLQNCMQGNVSLDMVTQESKEVLWNIIESYQAEVCFLFASGNEQDLEIRTHIEKLNHGFCEQTITPILKNLIETGSVRTDITLEYLVRYCQAVMGMGKSELLHTVCYQEEENRLTIQMKHEEWNVLYDMLIKLAISGLHS